MRHCSLVHALPGKELLSHAADEEPEEGGAKTNHLCHNEDAEADTDGDTVPSVVSFDDSATLTFAVGCAVSFTVKVAVPPASVVVSPLVGDTVNPDASSSVVVTDTSLGFSPL